MNNPNYVTKIQITFNKNKSKYKLVIYYIHNVARWFYKRWCSGC